MDSKLKEKRRQARYNRTNALRLLNRSIERAAAGETRTNTTMYKNSLAEAEAKLAAIESEIAEQSKEVKP